MTLTERLCISISEILHNCINVEEHFFPLEGLKKKIQYTDPEPQGHCRSVISL
ncbi:hypothetical protein PDJAM_G00167550, partial [Pangasius djambal]|nr:hypothetical protein [Pangasius djambal]